MDNFQLKSELTRLDVNIQVSGLIQPNAQCNYMFKYETYCENVSNFLRWMLLSCSEAPF